MIKLGGSLITDKRGEAAPRTEVLERLAREIAAARPQMQENLLIGHGSGSFGHAAAARHGVGRGPLAPGSAFGVSETRVVAARLHALVCDCLLQAELVPFTWAPSSALVARAGQPVQAAIEPLLAALDFDLLPVVYGDVVMDREWGAAICSTEAVLQYLAGRLRRRGVPVQRVLWLGATDGIYDAAGASIPRIDRHSYRQARRMIGATDGT
ncbi:MAG: uridylate kinase, partial [Acidobacteriota bacterium]